MVKLYNQTNGEPKEFAHGVDAKEAMAFGNYGQTPPGQSEPHPPRHPDAPEKEEHAAEKAAEKSEHQAEVTEKKGAAPVGDKVAEKIGAKKEEAKGKGRGAGSNIKD